MPTSAGAVPSAVGRSWAVIRYVASQVFRDAPLMWKSANAVVIVLAGAAGFAAEQQFGYRPVELPGLVTALCILASGSAVCAVRMSYVAFSTVPQFSVACPDDGSAVEEIPGHLTQNKGWRTAIDGTHRWYWVRAYAEGSLGTHATESVVAHLLAVSRRRNAAAIRAGEGPFERLKYDEALPLKWINNNDRSASTAPRLVRAGVKSWFNIVEVLPPENAMVLADGAPSNLLGLFPRHGAYRFEIVVGNHQCSKRLFVEVVCNPTGAPTASECESLGLKPGDH